MPYSVHVYVYICIYVYVFVCVRYVRKRTDIHMLFVLAMRQEFEQIAAVAAQTADDELLAQLAS